MVALTVELTCRIAGGAARSCALEFQPEPIHFAADPLSDPGPQHWSVQTRILPGEQLDLSENVTIEITRPDGTTQTLQTYGASAGSDGSLELLGVGELGTADEWAVRVGREARLHGAATGPPAPR